MYTKMENRLTSNELDFLYGYPYVDCAVTFPRNNNDTVGSNYCNCNGRKQSN
jgi:hypothetical protein